MIAESSALAPAPPRAPLTRAPSPPRVPLRLGPYELRVPVVLAPMAGITNRAFRRLCREQGGGLCVSEMVTSRALVERNAATLNMCTFDADEFPRSIQLYGVDPATVAAAVRMVVTEGLAEHIDLNMGCPVPKVTRKGGGAALPWKHDLFEAICTAAVTAAREASVAAGVATPPVTVKMRMGIDDDHLTYLRAGEIAAEAGMAWVALHARTAAQLYGGQARWEAISRLVEHLAPYDVPVLGNGDVWTGDDALAMVAQTGCAGVVVGRGCLGRPWLFAQLSAAFLGEAQPGDPELATVVATMRRHVELLIDVFGADRGPRDFRKHVAWYLKGFRIKHHVRLGLANLRGLDHFDELIADVDLSQEFPADIADKPRGRTSGGRPVTLPHGWLESNHIDVAGRRAVAAAEAFSSGG